MECHLVAAAFMILRGSTSWHFHQMKLAISIFCPKSMASRPFSLGGMKFGSCCLSFCLKGWYSLTSRYVLVGWHVHSCRVFGYYACLSSHRHEQKRPVQVMWMFFAACQECYTLIYTWNMIYIWYIVYEPTALGQRWLPCTTKHNLVFLHTLQPFFSQVRCRHTTSTHLWQ